MPIRITPPPAINCLMPCDFAPGLSLPYPSRRLTTPHTPRPAPMAVTRVCKIVTLLLKNAMRKCAEPVFCFVCIVVLRILQKASPISRDPSPAPSPFQYFSYLRFLPHHRLFMTVRAAAHGSSPDLRNEPLFHARLLSHGQQKRHIRKRVFPCRLILFSLRRSRRDQIGLTASS